jgi:hypothetical protein
MAWRGISLFSNLFKTTAMNTYYSVIFASVNSITSERLSVGLVMVEGDRIWFRYSKTKLSLMHQFFSNEAFYLLKTSLKNIAITANVEQVEELTVVNDLFNFKKEDRHTFSFEYLRYLSRYSNSTLTFNEPVKIDVGASDLLFDHLYCEFIFEETELNRKTSTIEIVKRSLYPQINKHVNWDYRVETGAIPGLIMSVELDFIGKNHQPVVGKITDFDQPVYNLDASLSNLFVLMKTFELNGETGNYFLIGNEPEKKNLKQHQTWEAVRNSSFLNFVPFNETDCISEYMETKSVIPYFEVEEA